MNVVRRQHSISDDGTDLSDCHVISRVLVLESEEWLLQCEGSKAQSDFWNGVPPYIVRK